MSGRLEIAARDGLDVDQARALARRLGVDVIFGYAPAREVPESQQDMVFHVGARSERAASIFANSTGRTSVRGSSVADIALIAKQRATQTAFVFVEEEAFDTAMAYALVRASLEHEIDIGIWPVDRDTGAADLAVIRLLALGARARCYPRGLLGYIDSVPGLERLPAQPWCFADGGVDEFVSAMRAGAETLVLHTHSNGIDMRLGGNVLCVQADELRPAEGKPGESFFPCQASGPCLRARLQPRAFIGAASVNAEVVVALTCSVVSPSDALIAPRFTWAAAVFRGDHVRALVAPFTLITGEGMIEATEHLLAPGISTGALARQLNVRNHRVPTYLCIGDPSIKAARPDGTGASLPASPEASDASSDVTPLESFFLKTLATSTSRPDLISRCETLARAFARNEATNENWNEAYCELLASFLGEGAFLSNRWMRCYSRMRYRRTLEQHGCGHPLLLGEVPVHVGPGAPNRWMWFCLRCAFAGDQPVGGERIMATVHENRVSIELLGFPSGCNVHVSGAFEPIGEGSERPTPGRVVRASGGVDVVELDLEPNLPMPGLRSFTAVVVWLGKFAIHRLYVSPLHRERVSFQRIAAESVE